jgi:hypothetical protein
MQTFTKQTWLVITINLRHPSLHNIQNVDRVVTNVFVADVHHSFELEKCRTDKVLPFLYQAGNKSLFSINLNKGPYFRILRSLLLDKTGRRLKMTTHDRQQYLSTRNIQVVVGAVVHVVI